MMKNWFSAVLCGAFLAVMSGCATAPAEPAREQLPASAVESSSGEKAEPVLSETPISTYLGGRDPIEGVNRSIFFCVDLFYSWLYRPIGYIYGSIVPRPVVRCINNFTDNLEFPRRFLGSLLQAKFTGGGIEILRFLSNSTIGLGGLFDPAWYWFGLPRQDEDFGQAFASWGIGPGCVLQLHYSSNIRDAIGMVFDYAVDIKSYFYGGQAFTFLNRGLDVFGQYETLRQGSFDSYQALKDYQLLVRRLQLDDQIPMPPRPVEKISSGQVKEGMEALPDYYSQGNAVDTLRSDWLQPSEDWWWVRLSLWNRNFGRLTDVDEVDVFPDGAPVSYRYRLQKENARAPLVVILPGVGGHNSAAMAVALAELCYKNGMVPVIVSNPMNWEFVEGAPGAPPGYGPDDAAKLREVLKAVLADLGKKTAELDKKEHPVAPERVVVLGYSQGGLNALLLAGLEAKEPQLKISRYLAVNPPVDLLKSLSQLDAFYRSLDDRSKEEALGMMLRGVGGYLVAARTPAQLHREGVAVPRADDPGKAETVDQVPMEELTARVLIGYSFRRSLEDMLVCMHHRAPVPGIKTPYQWGNRQELYEELAGWNFRRYSEEVLVPYHSARRGRPVTLEELNRDSGMRALAPMLRTNPDIRVIHSADDFLLDQSDRDFLRQTLGDRLTMYEHGGHLGNLYRDEVRRKILEILQSGENGVLP